MATEHKIDINKRDNIGKKAVKQLRKDGNIPGIYYSPSSKESAPIFITQGEYHEAVKSGAHIFNITVSGNTSSDKGGGIYIHWNNPNNENTLKIRNSFISNNSSENSGSGLFIQQCSPEIFNTLINNNLAAGNNSYNRDIFVWQANSYPSFINCTITNNQSHNL